MDSFRVTLVAALADTVIGMLIDTFIYENFWVTVPLVTGWTLIGYTRVFGKYRPEVSNYNSAIKAVVMALAWPLLPRLDNRR